MGKFPGIKMASGALRRILDSNRTVKHSIKAVTTYILPWAPQAEDGERMINLWMITAITPTPLHRVLLRNSNRLKGGRVHRYRLSILKAPKSSDLARKIKC